MITYIYTIAVLVVVAIVFLQTVCPQHYSIASSTCSLHVMTGDSSDDGGDRSRSDKNCSRSRGDKRRSRREKLSRSVERGDRGAGGASSAPADPNAMPLWFSGFNDRYRADVAERTIIDRDVKNALSRIDSSMKVLDDRSKATQNDLQALALRVQVIEDGGGRKSDAVGSGSGSTMATEGPSPSTMPPTSERKTVFVRGFHRDSAKREIEMIMNLQYSTQLTSDYGVEDWFVPGSRRNFCIVKFQSNKQAWDFIKYSSKNRQVVSSPVPGTTGSKDVKVYAQLEQTPQEAGVSGAVGRVTRACHLLKEQCPEVQIRDVEAVYGNTANPGRVYVRTNGGIEVQAISVSDISPTAAVGWCVESLAHIGVLQVHINKVNELL